MKNTEAVTLLQETVLEHRTGPNGMILATLPDGVTAQTVQQAYDTLVKDGNEKWKKAFKRGNVGFYWVPTAEQQASMEDGQATPFRDQVQYRMILWCKDNHQVVVPDRTFGECVEELAAMDVEEKRRMGEFQQTVIGTGEEPGALIQAILAYGQLHVDNQESATSAASLLQSHPELASKVMEAMVTGTAEASDDIEAGCEILGMGIKLRTARRSRALSMFGETSLFDAIFGWPGDEMMLMLGGIGSHNCGNPDCPFHGHLNR